MLRLTSLLGAACTLAPLASAQVRLLGVDTIGPALFEIDTTSGVRTLVGPLVGISGAIGALAWDPVAGILYMTSTSNDALWQLDPNTQVATLIGPFNVGGAEVMHGIELDSTTGVLYGKSTNVSGGGDFYSIDKVTGQATAIGTTGIGGFGGLEWINGTMYFSDTGGDSLYTIDIATGTVTLIGAYGIAGSVGIGFAYDPAFGLLANDNVTDSLYSINTATGVATLIGALGSSNVISLEFVGTGSLGTPYCTANANSTGVPGVLRATGSEAVASNNLRLTASSLPQSSFGYFLASMTQGNNPNPGGSQGVLCVASSIGRYLGPGQIQNTGAAGAISLDVDLTQTPTPIGPVAIAAGEVWNFQAWHRDSVGGAATSNFTEGLSVTFF